VKQLGLELFQMLCLMAAFGRNSTALNHDEIECEFVAFPIMSSQYLCGTTISDLPNPRYLIILGDEYTP
jgi:hypothetical protein